jgi:hypothetical protein
MRQALRTGRLQTLAAVAAHVAFAHCTSGLQRPADG